MWKSTAILLFATVLPASSRACEPSKACALERAQQLAIEHLAAQPHTYDQGGWMDMVHLVAMLEDAAAPGTAPIVAELLTQTRKAGRNDEVLAKLASELAGIWPERSLQMAAGIENTAERDDTYALLKDIHVDSGRLEYAARAVASMTAGEAKDQEALSLAIAQYKAGLAAAARNTATPFLRTKYRDEALHVLAYAAALEGDYGTALATAKSITEGEWTLAMIADLQLHRDQPALALVTLRRLAELLRRSQQRQTEDLLLEQFAAAGAVAEAMAVMAQLEIPPAKGLDAIAAGQVRAADLAGARTTLQRLSAAEREHTALWRLQEELLSTSGDIAAVVDEITRTVSFSFQAMAKDTAALLVEKGYRARAREILEYAVERARQSPTCSGDECSVVMVSSHAPHSPCADGHRDYQLCNLAVLQAKLGFIDTAEATAADIASPDLRITAWIAIAEAHAAASEFASARKTFERCLALMPVARESQMVIQRVIAAYANAIRRHVQLRDGLASLRDAANAAATPSNAQHALAAALASAGDLSAAFTVADGLIPRERVGAYIAIFQAAQ